MVVDNGVTSSDVVAIEGLLRVDLVFLWTSGCEAVIDDVEFFMFGMTIFDDFDGFVVLVDILIDIASFTPQMSIAKGVFIFLRSC